MTVEPEAHQHDSDIIFRGIYAYGAKDQAPSHDGDIIIKAVTAYDDKGDVSNHESDVIIKAIYAYGDQDQVAKDKLEHPQQWWGKEGLDDRLSICLLSRSWLLSWVTLKWVWD